MSTKILAVGTLTSVKYSFYSGQATMFEGFVNYLSKNKKYFVSVINISNAKSKKRKYGVFSFSRSIDYVFILINIFHKIFFDSYDILYITTAQSKVGFIRDYIIINFAKLNNMKIVAHQFGANYSGFYNNISPFLQKKVLDTLLKVNTIIVEGEFMKEQFHFLPNYNNIIKVIPNGLPISIGILPYEKKQILNNKIELIFLSNLILSKGYLDVLYAVKELVYQHNVDIHCTFVGRFTNVEDDFILPYNKKPEEYFNSFIEQYKLDKYITRIDGLYGDDKKKAFLKSHVFLLPSYFIYEGQPVSILEAMAYANVPIVTKYRHIPCMVDERNGFYVNPKSPNDIVNVILYILNHQDEYSNKSYLNIKKYLEEFTFDKYCLNLLKYFN